MSDDTKTWVTVKVPESDKEQADDYRPDGSTFGDCLVAGAERLNDSLDSDTPAGFDPGQIDEVLAASKADVPTTEEIVADLKNELSMANEAGVDVDEERLFEQLNELEERTGRIERLLEEALQA